MLDVLNWLSSFVILSVALAQLEVIHITNARTVVRAVGWCLVGLESFAAIIHPLWPQYATPGCKLGMIGLAMLAVSYGWQGATRQPMGNRRASDR